MALLREIVGHFRAGLAYQLVLLASRIHPPLFQELAGAMLKARATPTKDSNHG